MEQTCKGVEMNEKQAMVICRELERIADTLQRIEDTLKLIGETFVKQKTEQAKDVRVLPWVAESWGPTDGYD